MNKKEYKASDIEKAVLDSYFSTRQPVFQNMTHTVDEKKTTLQVQDDLLPTLRITDEVIVDYMLQSGYLLVQDDDGSPIWQMWRMR